MREKERERNIDVWEKYQSVASQMPPTGDLVGNPGMCPDWESNQQSFSLQDITQPTELHQSGQGVVLRGGLVAGPGFPITKNVVIHFLLYSVLSINPNALVWPNTKYAKYFFPPLFCYGNYPGGSLQSQAVVSVCGSLTCPQRFMLLFKPCFSELHSDLADTIVPKSMIFLYLHSYKIPLDIIHKDKCLSNL